MGFYLNTLAKVMMLNDERGNDLAAPHSILAKSWCVRRVVQGG